MSKLWHCSKCKDDKEYNKFYWDSFREEPMRYCIECQKVESKKNAEKNKEKNKVYQLQYRKLAKIKKDERSPESIEKGRKKQQRAWAKKKDRRKAYRLANKERDKAYWRGRYLLLAKEIKKKKELDKRGIIL